MRQKLYRIIESDNEGNKYSHFYSIFMIITIITSLIPLCTKSEAAWTFTIDKITVIVFIIDYLLRWITADLKYPQNGALAFVRYPFSGMAIIDLLSILPSFGVLGQGMRILKIFRMFKTLKILKTVKALKAFKAFKALKMLRYSRSIRLITNVIVNQKEALITVGGLAIGYLFIAALVIFNVEPDTFGSFFDAFYWACVSLTTVGYGDIYPVSAAGRIVTMLSAMVGIAIVALPAGIITAGYMDALNKEQNTDENEKENERLEENSDAAYDNK